MQPCLERGRLGALQGLLEKGDPTLEACSRYLIASCQFLQRRGYYNTLYQLQQFMMVGQPVYRKPCPLLGVSALGTTKAERVLPSLRQDHVRAAMTCIRFFTHGASSYLQLGEQQVPACCESLKPRAHSFLK